MRELADHVRGPVFQRGQDGYDDERAGFQTAFHHSPEVIIGALDAEDVQAAVRYAAANGKSVAVQSTGHGVSVLADDGVLITTKRLDSVRIDPKSRTAVIGAGAKWAQVVEKSEPHGLVPVSGSAGHVGVVGYTLAGGLGLLGREFGYMADWVRSVDVVTADGSLRHVTAATDPDLFWALRGGRDNFGVVTSIEVELQPVNGIYGGGLYFDFADAPRVLEFFRSWTADLPDTMTSSLGTMGYPPLPVFPEPLRGKHIVHIRFATTDKEAGPALVAPWLDVAPVLFNHLGEIAYKDGGSVYREPNFAHSYDGNSVLLSELPTEALDAIRELAGPSAEVPVIVDLRHLGGALSRQPEVPNAVSFRQAKYILRLLSPLDGLDLDVVRATHDKVYRVVEPWTLGRSLNFTYGERGATEFIESMYDKATFERLRELKAVYDPGNLFRRNHNIAPA
ncbi:FAD-binding oxidoreductase [Kutzneria chonburiensis]|uniref:FAD-binding oxidoreductase n=1 Tax=Kutzneria chonburiensis TaxID=1483604 RepID=A0ABV6N7C6_9PSEU|nr:FAD-binding oxidoreductase [Kutzneria chonburiensis]